jgi:hypothetical protein
MAPMALLALGEAVQSDFTPWIYKGLRWLGKNELDVDMLDDSANIIWRCVERTPINKYWKAAAYRVAGHKGRDSRTGLRPLFECRPYELGWLLYAFAHFNAE